MSIEEENLGFLHRHLVRGKDKCETFLRQREFQLDVKLPKLNKMEEKIEKQDELPEFRIISYDVWYHISKHIPPEYVQNFALICKQTNEIARSKSFWKYLYTKYVKTCDKTAWVLGLPAHLQYDFIRHFSPNIFRTSVVEALFHCYPPLMAHLNTYSLNMLVGRTYISAWHKHWENSTWIMCYQLKYCSMLSMQEKQRMKIPLTETVNDWESLAVSDSDDNSQKSYSSENPLIDPVNPYESVCLLLIYANRFIPIPKELTTDTSSNFFKIRLSAVRQPLTKDLREYNLELDFINIINKKIVTVKYPSVKYKVIPWWHTQFQKHIKFEACDKFD